MTPEALLAFEAAHPGHTAHKETLLLRRGWNVARYYLLLDRAAREHPELDPITAHRVLKPGRHTRFHQGRVA